MHMVGSRIEKRETRHSAPPVAQRAVEVATVVAHLFFLFLDLFSLFDGRMNDGNKFQVIIMIYDLIYCTGVVN